MSIGFLNRISELEQVKEALNQYEAALMIMDGVRQVGKSEILSQINREWDGTRLIYYYEFTKFDPVDQLEQIQEELRIKLNDQSLIFQTWEHLFQFVMQRSDIIWFFDELPYLIEKEDSIPTIIQKTWDEYTKRRKPPSRSKLLLCGSYISIMEEVLSILTHGRVTKRFRIPSMNFLEARLFLSQTTFEEQIILYAIFGGIPIYLTKIQPFYRNSYEEVLIKHVFAPDSPYYDAIPYLLHSQIRETSRYLSILSAIAKRNYSYSDIQNATRMQGKNLNHYINNLIGLQQIKRELPFLGDERPRYYLTDPFTRFWFLFFKKVLSPKRYVEEYVLPNLATKFLGFRFEEIGREILQNLSIQGKCTDTFEDIHFYEGKYENPSTKKEETYEIDIIALGQTKQTLIIGECKWESTYPSVHEIRHFKRIANRFLDTAQSAGYDYESEYEEIKFAFFYRGEANLTRELPSKVKDIQVISLNDLAYWLNLSPDPSDKVI